MSLPDPLRSRLEEEFGPVRVEGPVGGGCVHQALRIELETGPAFLKYDEEAPSELFSVEAGGLRQLRRAASDLYVPRVLGVGENETPGWILMEWLEPGERNRSFAEQLGWGLAALHRRRQAGWGGGGEGFIGPLPQSNASTGNWAEFWRERRLEPQLRRARDAGRMPGTPDDWERLFRSLPERLAPAEEDGPSLLHGDLWGGNVLALSTGEAALVDPATYSGHREVDLAMAELFGGFAPAFYAAYEEMWPLLPGYLKSRRSVYQLYYLLVHVNLFGAGYLSRTEAALREALGPET